MEPRDVNGNGGQYRAFAILFGGATAATVVLIAAGSRSFEKYFGDGNPVLVLVAVGAVGFLILRFLHAHAGFEIYSAGHRRGVMVGAQFATTLAVPVILVDVLVGFPRDMNVLPPESLAFYPAIGFVAEIVFHIIPIAVLFVVLKPLFRRLPPSSLIWTCLVLTSLVEAGFQVVFGGTGEALSFLGAYVGVHLFVFGLCQMYVFRRYDFVSMYAFRIVYYLYWHIAWGTIRLDVLF
jgi:hypothetical protein